MSRFMVGRRLIKIKAIFCFLTLVSLASQSIASICAIERNVQEYFLSIPADMLLIGDDIKGPLDRRYERAQAIALVDFKNGFIELQNETILSKYQIVLFRGKNRAPYLFVTVDGMSVQNLYVFSCMDSTWIDVTNKFMPNISIEEATEMYNKNNIQVDAQNVTIKQLSMVAHTLVRYRLPRYGKKIELYASHPDLSWDELKPLKKFVPVFP